MMTRRALSLGEEGKSKFFGDFRTNLYLPDL